MTKLTLADIADLRAYESEREAFRAHVIEIKKIRRVPVGPVVSLIFENAETIRFQVQEMVRAERNLSDVRVQEELDVYNPLIPEPGQLCATLFVELTSQEEMRRWLPSLVGIEREVELRLGPAVSGGSDPAQAAAGDSGGAVVRCFPEAAHQSSLTREEVTPSVHYLTFAFTPEQVELLRRGPVSLAVTHPSYREETLLGEETRAALLGDLEKGG